MAGIRIALRISADQKTLLARAASYAGVSLSNFLVSAAADRAKELVAERETLTLTPRDWSKFLAALDKADRPRWTNTSGATPARTRTLASPGPLSRSAPPSRNA